jgi:hypothetical protein
VGKDQALPPVPQPRQAGIRVPTGEAPVCVAASPNYLAQHRKVLGIGQL